MIGYANKDVNEKTEVVNTFGENYSQPVRFPKVKDLKRKSECIKSDGKKRNKRSAPHDESIVTVDQSLVEGAGVGPVEMIDSPQLQGKKFDRFIYS